ncbi:hypothetical protein ASF62_12045 [Leifsonia sp. Leaf325]|nr:metallophosphoesterase [Leifsonia sp. Leaf325]KQQ92575.1 hypothetical protein ASF62_12045 [Leifsonia sp. Leaf325]
MIAEYPAPPLLTPDDRIGLLGDAHGDLGDILQAARSLREMDINTLIVLGDFAVVWPGENWGHNLDRLANRLNKLGQTLYFLHGNHDWIPRLMEFPLSADGLRWLRPSIAYMATGFRAEFASGREFVVIGGANSIDREMRTEGKSWWPEESITWADLDAVGTDHADIMFGHDSPLDLMELDRRFASTDRYWSDESLEYALQGRRMLTKALHAVGPELFVGGHQHFHLDEVIGYLGYVANRSRVVILDKLQATQTASVAILDTSTLELDYLTTAGVAVPPVPQVTDLADVHSGRWAVHTVGSIHVFDLDRRTVTRHPGRYALRGPNDRELDLRTLDCGRIGEMGRWTMYSDDFLTDFLWHRSSLIRHIERLTAEEGS